MLTSIQTPADLRRLSLRETEALASEIRQALIDSIALTGGHLASNLGAVELTLALHRVLDTPADKLFFDVGHQSYTHKLLTGRHDLLKTLRSEGGVSGFPKRDESAYDAFGTGHASTALSAALGMARARDLQGEGYAIAALVGDGALTGGMCYEALNDAGSRPTQLIMLLNDNEMSIAHNVGALSKYLTRLRGSEKWIDAKHTVKRGINRVPVIGAPIFSAMEKLKRTAKLMLIPGEFFEALGFGYLGPIDGHDIPTLERALRDARAMNRPVVVHAVTQKGRGYALAEKQPERYHGVAPFSSDEPDSGSDSSAIRTVSGAQVAGETLVALAREDRRIIAITAAMQQGTGLSEFAERFPDRFFDVGIAEEHAMTMAAGMAAGGMRPVFAVYASFLQRAVDQLLHDACLQNLPVTVLVDHAGFVPGDGATHQGIYDVAMLRAMPNLTIWSPADAAELREMIAAAMHLPGPCVIRYAKCVPEAIGDAMPIGEWRTLREGAAVQLVAYGHALETAMEVAGRLHADGIACGVTAATTLHRLDEKWLASVPPGQLIAVLEEAPVAGGLGEAICAQASGVQVLPLGIDDDMIPTAHTMDGLARQCGLDAETVARRIREALHG